MEQGNHKTGAGAGCSISGKNCVLGIDPGKTGALAVVCGDVLMAKAPVPTYTRLVSRTRKTFLDSHELKKLIAEWRRLYDFRWCAIESVHASPQMGRTSAFSFGHTTGIILGILEGLGIPNVRGVEPSVWKPRLGLSSDKTRSLAKFEEVFGVATKDDGEAEAALIGWFAQRQVNNSTEDAMT